MSRRPHPSQRFMTHAQDASRNDVLQTETSKSLRQVLRAARATGALALAGRRLRELPVESYAPTPDDLDEGEKFWEIVELKSFDCSHNKLDELPSDWRDINFTTAPRGKEPAGHATRSAVCRIYRHWNCWTRATID